MVQATATPDRPLLFYVGAGLCGFLTLLCVLMLMLFLGSGDDEVLRATASGQRISIDSKSGKVSGVVESAKPVQTEENTDTVEEASVGEDTPPAPAFDVGPEEGVEGDTPVEANPTPDTTSEFVASEEEAATSIRVYPRSATSLTAAPAEGLHEQTEWGTLPKTSSVGSVSRYYARPIAEGIKKPVVAIIVSGIGHSKMAAEKALELPLDISLSFDPYAPKTPLWAESARNIGHEAWLMLPAQPADFPASDPGPKSLLNDLSVEDNLTRLRQTLSTYDGYVGAVLPPNQVFSDSEANFLAITKEIKKRGVALLASTKPTEPKSYSWFKKNRKMGLLANDLIDETLNEASILARLRTLESKAQNNGQAIGIIRAYPLSMQLVEAWSKELADKGITLVPASALLDM